MTGIRGYLRPNIPNQHHSAINCFLIVKLATPVMKFAYRWHPYGSNFAVREIQAPLVRLRVIQMHIQSFHVTRRTIRLEFDDIAFSVPDLAHHRSALVFAPGVRASKRMSYASIQLEVGFPGTDFKIKIVLAIALWLFILA